MYNKYVFDSGPLIDLFTHYYPSRFTSLWEDFNDLVKNGQLMSVREVSKELESHGDHLTKWTKDNKELFTVPHIDELEIVVKIFKKKHFQNVVRRQEILQGKPVADPFVVARAKYIDAFVVTTEKFKGNNGAKLPNICSYLDVKFINLEKFMELEKWKF